MSSGGRRKLHGRRSRLKRAPARKNPVKEFILYCEGERTEPGYFSILEAVLSKHVRIIVHGGKGVPLTLAKHACEEKKKQRKQRDSWVKDDQIWVVFDRDTHPNFAEAVKKCDDNAVDVARSNPCFELWLILHKKDYDRPCDGRDVQKELAQLCPEYDRNSGKVLDFESLCPGIDDALERGQAQLARREAEGKPFSEPSTTVFRLVNAIKAAALAWGQK